MATDVLQEVYEQYIKPLSPEQRLKLVEMIKHGLGDFAEENLRKGRRWEEIKGIVPYPMCGEDAQRWVSHGRQEPDEHREKQRNRHV